MSTPSATVLPQTFSYPQNFKSPFTPTNGTTRPVDITGVAILGGYWADMQTKNQTVMIAHCESWLEELGWIKNFDLAGRGEIVGQRAGREFSDSETYKLLEAMAWEIGRSGDTALDARFEALVDRILPVQEPDGYLSTMFGRPGQAPRYSDLEWGHELYCYGHLIQAGIARARSTGRDRFVDMVIRVADHVCKTFGPGGIDNICGHAEIETALAELSRLTGDKKYLDQAELFIDRHGHGRLGIIEFGQQYFQDDVPVRERRIMAGHAVRENYLLAGVVDVAVENKDEDLLRAAIDQTLATAARRTYITGAQGAHHEGESFGSDFELPSDRAYAETCAGIASVQLNHRLLLATGSAEHGDIVERTLFNVVSAGPSADGKAFYYINTLHQRDQGNIVPQDKVSFRAAASQRAPWYAVSCCPTNLTRTIASISAYMASTDSSALYIHQFATSRITATVGDLETRVLVETNYPHDGVVSFLVEEVSKESGMFELAVRIPAWAAGASLTVNSAPEVDAPVGYAVVPQLKAGDRVTLTLPMMPRWIQADYRVDATRGQVAVERGPLVFAMESIDLGDTVNTVAVDTSNPPMFDGTDILVHAANVTVPDKPWPFGAPEPHTQLDRGQVRLVPYATWGNRGPSTMRVWMPEQV